MEALQGVLDSYGPLLLFGLGFAEYAGAPIASVPFLVAAGALSGTVGVGLPTIVALAATGGLAADGLWYGLARWKGSGLVGAACALSSNRGSCITSVEARVARLGAPYILAAKFIPGAGNLVAPAAGFGGYPVFRFLALDAVALLGWATAYAALGRVFTPQVEAVIVVTERYTAWVLVLGAALVVAGGAYRILKSRGHAHGHMHEPAPEAIITGGGRVRAETKPAASTRSGAAPADQEASSHARDRVRGRTRGR